LLEYLSEGIGDTIIAVECDTLNSLELMHAVHEGLINYTVVEEYIAKMGSYNLSSLDTKLAVSVEHPIGWVIQRHEADSSLLTSINDWIANAEQKHLRKVMLRYIKNGKYISSRREESNKRLSSFDSSIKKTAKKIGWDWRLLAALIYQESRFKVDLESEKGAYGLMQLMPSVMKKYGIGYDSTPEEQLEAGGKLITHLDKSLKNRVVDSLERVKFVLAAYNAGLGHVYDAQRLAQKFGKAPDLWEDNVDYYILNKSKYLNDTCCKSGYLRGTQTYRFVEEIMDRYSHYQTLLD
jgi:membrane-bound lytic murein transglycosylase F